jgi:hypothetical protein
LLPFRRGRPLGLSVEVQARRWGRSFGGPKHNVPASHSTAVALASFLFIWRRKHRRGVAGAVRNLLTPSLCQHRPGTHSEWHELAAIWRSRAKAHGQASSETGHSRCGSVVSRGEAAMPQRVIPMNGAYYQVFGVKKQARVAGHPSNRGAPLRKCSKGYFRALSAWREGALGAYPSFRRAFAARSLLCAPNTWKERAARPGPPLIVARTTAWVQNSAAAANFPACWLVYSVSAVSENLCGLTSLPTLTPAFSLRVRHALVGIVRQRAGSFTALAMM